MKKMIFLLCFFLFSCSKQECGLTNHTFQTQLEEQDITLTFHEDGRFSGQVINNYFGKYKIHKNQITLTLQGSTMKMGPLSQIKTEEKYFQSLKEINTLTLLNNNLILKGKDIEYNFVLLNSNQMDIH